MSVRIGRPGTGTDRALQAVVVVTAVLVTVGVLALARAAIGGRSDYRTVRVDNQAGLAVQVDAVDEGGGRMGLGEADAQTTSTFQEVADLGRTWTFVISYGGREVSRQTMTGAALAGRDWTVQIPADATADLERQGLQ
jgi:hypothetical protein